MIILMILTMKFLLIMNRKTSKSFQNRDENAVYFNNAQNIQHVQ